MKWTEHGEEVLGKLRGVKGLLSRLVAHIPRDHLLPIVHGLLISRIRYGLSLFGSVRTSESDASNHLMSRMQIELNKVLRLVCGKRLSDRISTKDLHQCANVLSVNQMAAECQLREVWRTLNHKLPAAEYFPMMDDVKERISVLLRLS